VAVIPANSRQFSLKTTSPYPTVVKETIAKYNAGSNRSNRPIAKYTAAQHQMDKVRTSKIQRSATSNNAIGRILECLSFNAKSTNRKARFAKSKSNIAMTIVMVITADPINSAFSTSGSHLADWDCCAPPRRSALQAS
jgi:hypothetical protein